MSIRIQSGDNDPIIGGISISISISIIHIQQRMGSAPFWEGVRERNLGDERLEIRL